MSKKISLNDLFTNPQNSPKSFYENLLAFALLVFSFAIIFPELFFLRLTPMGGVPSAIKDPAVSWAAFMPAFREFRYELLENGNILWSNLRSFGLPMLGNAVQGAPLFPLNLALIGLPDHLYWSVMPITRTILIGLGTHLLCRKIFGLSLIASLCFAFLAGFNINVLRWINHPWQNGLLAGIWYTYFCCTLFLHSSAKRSRLILHWAGLVLAVFGMITNGFPEASAMAALFAILLFSAFILSNWSQLKPSLFKPLLLIILAHVVGLSLSAVQIFALLEFIQVSQAIELREGFIGGVFKQHEQVPFLLSQFTYFWLTEDVLKYLNFSIGLFGTFFMVRGLCLWLKTSQKPWIGIACLLMMTLFIVKSFGLSPIVEWFFAKTPVLAQSHFPLYFSPLFYLGAAYFVALGVESYVKSFNASFNSRVIDFSVSCLAGMIVVVLCVLYIRHFMQMPWFGLIEFIFREELRHFLFFLIGSGLLVSLQFLCLFEAVKTKTLSRKLTSGFCLSLVLIFCFITEMTITHFDKHDKFDKFSLRLDRDLTTTFEQVISRVPVPQHELRSNDRNGDYVNYGLATADNGISAILPYDLRKIREEIFQTTYAGYYPLDLTRRPWSWETISSNLVIVNTTPRVNIDWSSKQLEPKIYPNALDWQSTITIPRTQPFQLEGEIEGYFETIPNIIPWVHFQGQEHDFWIEANISSSRHLGNYQNRSKVLTKWRVRIPNEWLLEDQYEIKVRQGKKSGSTYADTAVSTLTLMPLQKNTENRTKYADLTNTEFVGASPDEDLHFFYNPKALPSAYVASECQTINDLEETIVFLKTSDAVINGVVALDNVANTSLNCDDYAADFKRIPITSDTGSQLKLENIQGPVLIAVNNYHYPGWQAKDLQSGEKLPILKSNGIFRAVYLPENRDYQIQMDYQPAWLKIVYGLFVLALIIILTVWIALGRTQRKVAA